MSKVLGQRPEPHDETVVIRVRISRALHNQVQTYLEGLKSRNLKRISQNQLIVDLLEYHFYPKDDKPR